MAEFHEEPGWRAHLSAPKLELLGVKLGPAILADMQLGTPVDTGALLASLAVEVVDEDHLRVGSRDVDYSRWVEDGHQQAYRNAAGDIVQTGVFVPPQPFMRPALYRERGDAS